jgi:putative ABC transport system permease protein
MGPFSRVPFRIFRMLLLTFPREVREESGAEMIETVRRRAEEMRTRTGARGRAHFWARELTAVLRGGLRLRLAGAREGFRALAPLPSQGWYELRLGLRSLARNPAFTATGALTVALGIGATTVVFSFVEGILLSPLPYEDPGGLVMISTVEGRGGSESEPEFMAFRTEAKSLEAVAATRGVSRTLQVDGQPRRIVTLETTHELFRILGVPPTLGRSFTDEEDVRGAPRVAVLSYGLWMEMFGADPAVLDRSLTLDGEPYQVIGVMPAGFHFPSSETALWTAYRIDSANLDYWNNHYLRVYGRLKEGVPLGAARAEIRAMGERFVAEHGEYLEGLGYSSDLVLLSEQIVGPTRTPLLVLLVAVAFLLLMGCTNVANLLLARGESRRQESAVRSALGAPRARMVLHSMMESISLAMVGGTVGVLVAVVGVRAIRSFAGDTIPRAEEIGIDPGVLAFTAAVTILTGLLFGLLPALATGHSDLQTHLKEGGRSLSGSRRARTTRRLLVTSEVALAVVLVIGAGIMVRSVVKLYRSDPGFRTENVLTTRVSLPEDGIAGEQDPAAFYQGLLDRVESLPGVSSAGAVSRLPLFEGIGLWSIQIRGREVANIGNAPVAELEQVTPGYFRTMDLALREGRFLEKTDDAGARMTVVVNEAFEREHWPGESALGRQVKLFSHDLPWMEIVGVVGNERHGSLQAEPRPKMYVPHVQASQSTYGAEGTMNLVVFGENVKHLAGPIRALVSRMNSAAPVYNVQTMEAIKAGAMADHSYPTILLTLFGVVALFLASVGIYGLVAFDASQGRHDIGVRVALGATGADVRRRVVGGGLVPVGVGIGLGMAAAIGLTRLLGSLLFRVSPLDPTVYVGVPVVLLLVATTASLFPAVRAARMDPADVLRAE